MATTVTNANLTVTVTDTVTLNGQSYGNTNTLTVASIDEVYSRVVEVPISAFTPVLQLGSTGQGQLTAAGTVNLPDLAFAGDSGSGAIDFNTDAMVIKLEAGKSFMLGGVSFDAAAADIAQGAVSHNSAFVILQAQQELVK